LILAITREALPDGSFCLHVQYCCGKDPGVKSLQMRPTASHVQLVLTLLGGLACAAVTAFGLDALLSSPYTGLRLVPCGTHACVHSVDEGSPAAKAGVRAGDTLLGFAEEELSEVAFAADPDYLPDWPARHRFFEELSKLTRLVRVGESVTLRLGRDGSETLARVVPAPFRIGLALARTLPVYVVAWTFFVVAFLVLRKRRSAAAVVNALVGATVCLSFASLAAYTARDVAFPAAAFRLLSLTNYLGAMVASFAFVHLALVFPRQSRVLARRPWLPAVLYGVLALVFLFEALELFADPDVTRYLPMSVCLLAFVVMLVVGFIRDRNPLRRRQIQWVVLGFTLGIGAWVLLTSLPALAGAPLVSEELSALPSVLIPLSLAFAVTRYRLMDIERIVDLAVVYGFTIALLELVEILFLGKLAPHALPAAGPAFTSLIAVLLIVFLYVPVRRGVALFVARLFRRHRFILEDELRRFVARLDERQRGEPAVAELGRFLQDLLAPRAIVILSREAGGAARELASATTGDETFAGIVRDQADALFARAETAHGCSFGYEATDRLALHEAAKGLLDVALISPVLAGEHVSYLLVLAERAAGRAFDLADAALLEALALQLTHVLRAEEQRQSRMRLEEEFKQQKEAVMKEMHDGVGGMLTSIAASSQAAGGLIDSDLKLTRDMLKNIDDVAREAIDALRLGLGFLDAESEELGPMLAVARQRFVSLAAGLGIRVSFEVGADVYELRAGPQVCLNLLRALQEALGNVIKHAAATEVGVRIELRAAGLLVEVRDNGSGFERRASSVGYGLGNLESRMQAIGGQALVDSQPGAGTVVRLEVPAAMLASEGSPADSARRRQRDAAQAGPRCG
jgi:two-component system, NarL family, sensor kinase